MAAMQLRRERICLAVAGESSRLSRLEFGATRSIKMMFCRARKLTCDKASPERAVMLHLRARYVSKAAILTIPAPRVPVENRSPA